MTVYTYVAQVNEAGDGTTNRTRDQTQCKALKDFLDREAAKAYLEAFLDTMYCTTPGRWVFTQATDTGTYSAFFFNVVETPRYVVE